MSILNILCYPDPRLKKRAEPVEVIDETIHQLIDDMLETMYQAPGIGLAAPQVNVSKRLIVLDISENKNNPMVLVNPEIIDKKGSMQMEEGCLSVPGIFEPVDRARYIRFKAKDREDVEVDLEVEELLAVCIQHEIDHLDGKLFVDYLTELKRQRIKNRIEKLRRKVL